MRDVTSRRFTKHVRASQPFSPNGLSSLDGVLYRWVTFRKALLALREDRVRASRWSHFLEHERRFARGSSWSKDPNRWQIRETPICLAITPKGIPNRQHDINGQRTYLLTQAMQDTRGIWDPVAYECESTTPDETFIEGPLVSLHCLLKGVWFQQGIPSRDEPSWFPATERDAALALLTTLSRPT